MHIKTIVFGITLCLATLTKAAPAPRPLLDGLLGNLGDAVDDILNDLLGPGHRRERPGIDYNYDDPRGRNGFDFPEFGDEGDDDDDDDDDD
jgi:hypothetical protein